MITSRACTVSLGQQLWASGWRQGALFVASSASISYNSLSSALGTTEFRVMSQPIPKDSKLVVASQDCDINAHEGSEPYVEALLCAVHPARDVRGIRLNSNRKFVVDGAAGLVALGGCKLYFSKEALIGVSPQPWPGDMESLGLFRKWLARRYRRPALPDDFNVFVRRPVDGVFKSIEKSRPDVMAAFSDSVAEVRVSVPASESPPYDLQLVLLVRSCGLTEEGLDAIDVIGAEIRKKLDAEQVHLDTDIRIVTRQEMSVAEFENTVQILLEDYTYSGSEILGAEPVSIE